jgi:hypothetical protein
MKTLHFALSIGAAALLAGCGESQPPIGGPGAMPQNRAIATHSAHRDSSSNGDLIYASIPFASVYMFTYPDGKFVASFSPPALAVDGLCVDSGGNVFVLTRDPSYVIKYAHGATSPSSTIDGYDDGAYACSVDPTTGDLAVVYYTLSDTVVVAVYPDASGTPTYYTLPNGGGQPGYCAYDSQGDLFVDAGDSELDRFALFELPSGGSEFSLLTLSKEIRVGTLQWVSSYLAVSDRSHTIYRLSISGSTATVIGHTNAVDLKPHPWIQDGDIVIAPYGKAGKGIGFWNYPKGGKVTKTIGQVDKNFKKVNSIIVSVGSSR